MAGWKTVPFNPRQRFPELNRLLVEFIVRNVKQSQAVDRKFGITLGIGAVCGTHSGAVITSGRTEPGFRLPPLRRLCSCCPPTQARKIMIPPSLQAPPNVSHRHSTLPRGKAMGRISMHARKALGANPDRPPTPSRSVPHVSNPELLIASHYERRSSSSAASRDRLL
jgi:hypothetical protein